jgi:membrane associated rhomboid family serine protease
VLPLRDHLPTRTFPFVNYLLIAANVAVFAYERLQIASGVSPDRLLETLGLVPRMLYLWIFGDNVEDAMGHTRYALFYLAGGVCAAAAQVLVSPMSLVPMVGASGAISAVLAAYAFLYPRSPITVLNPVPLLWIFWGLFLQFPAWLVIALFFVANLWNALAMSSQGGVAFMAHVGGFIGGAVLLGVFMAGRTRMDDYARWQRWAERRRRMERDGL